MKTPPILISQCYSEVTPESAEAGDFSDSGFIRECEPMTFRELVNLLWAGGFYREGETEWLTTGWSTTDYTAATEQEETLHFHRANHSRMRKWFELAIRTVEAKRKRLYNS